MKQTLHSLIVAVSLYLISPATAFCQAPNLGTVADFVLFTTAGGVGNTGPSHLTGNIGTNTGAITAFGNVNGVMHNSDVATGQAANDLLSAYTQIDTLTATAHPSVLLGGGDTLSAGVYSIDGGTTLNGALILNAKGNGNAVFVFQIQGTFSSGDSSRIILVNGAVACNVFWKVEGMISLGAGTIMKGTMIANNAAIQLSAGVNLEGRALSTTGAITINNGLAYTPVGCGRPLLTGPAAPQLASTACYAIFSGSGGIMNGGISTVTGDVGSNGGLTVGYNPLLVNGTIHLMPDLSTAACAADLLHVYDYLDTIPYDIELLFPAQFGHNLVLTPHVYLMSSATTFTDSLYLDAEGNADAIFVIKVTGAFSTSRLSKVILVNGAQAKNIFWKVEGAVAISDSSDFTGTIVCHNGAISLANGTNISGRALTTSGALSTASVSVVIPQAGPCSVLPVTWIYFRSKVVQSGVLLEWSTTNQINNGSFTIEKSEDGLTFAVLATIAVNTIQGTQRYNSFTDVHPSEKNFYRISNTDESGLKTYYRTIEAGIDIRPGFKAIEYAEGSTLYMQVSGATPGNGSLEVYSMDGKKLASQQIILSKEVTTYQLVKTLHKGIYLLSIKSNNALLKTLKAVVL